MTFSKNESTMLLTLTGNREGSHMAKAPEKPVSAPKRLTLFRGATLIDGKGGAARPNVSILVEGDRIKAVMPDMIAARAGSIVNIGSVDGLTARISG